MKGTIQFRPRGQRNDEANSQRSVDRDERISTAIGEFLAASETGDADRSALLVKYSDVAEELACCLDALDFMNAVGPQLADSPTDAKRGPTAAISALSTLGDFRILREIGRGGMGIVYEAEQLSLGRRVALKVLPFAAMFDRQQLARFKNEARAAGTLDHPNIVAIYSVGVERSVHFYAMQLIEGQSLADVIAERRKAERGSRKDRDGGPGDVDGEVSSVAETADYAHQFAIRTPQSAIETRPVAHLSTLPDANTKEYYRAIARLGVQAAEALDHAHQNGILHRDIKPANLLVDHTGKLWVTDFGLARIEQDAGLTMSGDILGTLRYMSPEQALANRVVVDHRSDIYSLGITLYELLTLQPAYTSDDRHELLRQIAFDEPMPLRQINVNIPLDLETIVLKAIQKSPEQRYVTANDLANDLRSFLNHEPIKAKPPTWREKAVKWSRRHPAGVRATALAAVVTVIAVSSSIGWIIRDQAARRALVRAHVELAISEAKTWYESNKPAEALSAAKRAEAILDADEGSPEMVSGVAQWCADMETVQQLALLRDERGDDSKPQVRSYADVFRSFADVFQRYGIDTNAKNVDEAASKIRRSRIKEDLIRALDVWCHTGSDGTGQDKSRPVVNAQLLALAKQADPDPWRNRLRDAIQSGDTAILEQLAHEEEHLAAQSAPILVLLAQEFQVRELHPQAIEVLKYAQRRFPNDFFVNIHLASSLRLLEPPRTEEAIAYRRAAVAIHPNSMRARNHLAYALSAGGYSQDAEDTFRDAIRMSPDTALNYYSFAEHFLRFGNEDQARAIFAEAPPPTSDNYREHLAKGALLLRFGESAQAETAIRDAIRLVPTWAEAHRKLGCALCIQGRYSEGEAAFREALRLRPEDPITSRLLHRALIDQGKIAEAESLQTRSIGTQQSSVGNEPAPTTR